MISNSITYLVGLFGGLGTTFSFAPQVLRVYRTTDMDGLSPTMMIIHATGVCSWIAYGILRKDFYVIVFNILTLTMVILIMSRYGYVTTLSKRNMQLPTTTASTSTTSGTSVTGARMAWLKIWIGGE
jgi:MtN3 and saliva related transmembrane protein